ncbi:MAG: hypothetical protein M0Z30_01230 [Actinomycetota bacterium]|nr:hypothetical protein [Actinomycetota bacterium]
MEHGTPGRYPTTPDKIGMVSLQGVINEFPVHPGGVAGVPGASTGGPDGSL